MIKDKVHANILSAPCTLAQLLKYFFCLGATGFGGAIALIGYMQRDLVEKNKWVSKEEYLDGLALAQIVPGPVAGQLAIYIGYIRFSLIGATLVPIALIFPSFVIVLVISYLYVKFEGLNLIQALFYGISSGTIGIIIRSAYNLAKVTLKKDFFLFLIFILLIFAAAFTKIELGVLFIASGILYTLINTNTLKGFKNLSGLLTIPLMVNPACGAVSRTFEITILKIAVFFAKAGAFTFGSGLVIVPLLSQVVTKYHWLTEKQFMDAVAIGMITPGPVLIATAFIGYLLKGITGATVAIISVFVPAYLFVLILGPAFKKYSKNPVLSLFIKGITTAACGAIGGTCIHLARQAITDIQTLIIAASALLLPIKFKNIPEPLIILGAGIAGLLCFK